MTMTLLYRCLWAASAGLFAAAAAFAAEVTVLDGNTIDISGTQYPLYGIAAPAPGERCAIRGRTLDCGKVARAQLQDLTAGASVTCAWLAGTSGIGRKAKCLANGYDVSYGMIYTGWAVATDGTFEVLEQSARDARRGMWRGDAVQGEVQTSR